MVQNPIMGDWLPKNNFVEKNKCSLYFATKSNAPKNPIPNLLGGGGGAYWVIMMDIGSLLIEGDFRFQKINIISEIGAGINTSYSFDPNTMTCKCCGRFRGGGGVRRKPKYGSFLTKTSPPFYPVMGRALASKL
jgi:hypothetical protein